MRAGTKTAKIVELALQNPRPSYKQIAYEVGCSPQMVSVVVCRHFQGRRAKVGDAAHMLPIHLYQFLLNRAAREQRPIERLIIEYLTAAIEKEIGEDERL